jgi:hypothetical protein
MPKIESNGKVLWKSSIQAQKREINDLQTENLPIFRRSARECGDGDCKIDVSREWEALPPKAKGGTPNRCYEWLTKRKMFSSFWPYSGVRGREHS